MKWIDTALKWVVDLTRSYGVSAEVTDSGSVAYAKKKLDFDDNGPFSHLKYYVKVFGVYFVLRL